MKFSLFSDFHHQPGRFPGAGEAELEIIQNRAEKENVDFIIHAGDFCHGPTVCREFIKKYNGFHIPSYHCLGNHDTDKSSLAHTLELYNMPHQYYCFDCKGYRFIVFDPNYCNVDGICHFEINSTSFDWLKCTHEFYPAELCEKVENLNHCLVWNDPVHAIVTLEGTTITIEGMESEFFMGITADMIDGTPKYDKSGRPAVAGVMSAKITLH